MHRAIAGGKAILRQVTTDNDGIRPHRLQPAQHHIQASEPVSRPVRMDIAELGNDHAGFAVRTKATTDRGVKVAVPSDRTTVATLSDSTPTAHSPSGKRATTGSTRRLNQTSNSSSL